MTLPYHLILASKSPRRHYLLRELGLPFLVKTKDVDESFPSSLKGKEIPLYLSMKKSSAFQQEMQEKELLITADTIVWINDQVLNKPEDEQQAIEMLSLLSGVEHEVFTGVCLTTTTSVHTFSVSSKVTFRRLDPGEIKHYVATYRPFDKAGGYGAQEGLAADAKPCSSEEVAFLKQHHLEHLNSAHMGEENIHLTPFPIIDLIKGSYFNVMGLPIVELYSELKNIL